MWALNVMESKSKRILFIVNELEFYLSHRAIIGNTLVRKGFEVKIIAFFEGDIGRFNCRDFDELKTHVMITNSRSILSLLSPLFFIRLIKIVRIFKPNIVHLTTPLAHIIGGSASLFCRTNRVYAFAGLGALFSKSIFHLILRPFVVAIYRFLLRRDLTFAIFQKKEDENFIQELISPKFSGTLMTTGSGVDLDLYKPKLTSQSPKLRIGMASRLIQQKGVTDFLKAAKIVTNKYQDVVFVLAGAKTKTHYFNRSFNATIDNIKAYGVDHVGFMSDMPKFLSELDLFVYPSYYLEGVPKVLLEAQATGLPCVVSNWPGCLAAVTPSKTALICQVKDPDDIAKKICNLIENRALRSTMSLAARRAAELNFSSQVVADSHLGFFNMILSKDPIS